MQTDRGLNQLNYKHSTRLGVKYRKTILYLYIKYTVDQVYLYLYLAMYQVFVFVIGIFMLVFDPKSGQHSICTANEHCSTGGLCKMLLQMFIGTLATRVTVYLHVLLAVEQL